MLDATHDLRLDQRTTPGGERRQTLSAKSDATSASINWTAVIGGSIVVASTCLILLALGAGLGLSTISPWGVSGETIKTIGGATIAWLVVMQILSGSLGGYLAGRFRNRWAGIHGDEVYFRDTAHGFLSWGLAFVGTAAFLGAASTILAGGAAAGTGVAMTQERSDPSAYFVDMMLRSDSLPGFAATPDMRTELGRILKKALAEGSMSTPDVAYAGALVSRATGVTAQRAEQRVSNVLAQAEASAAAIQKATGHALLWIFLALLIGAFTASVAATIGGRHRDSVLTPV